jgi:Domain of unknown function (DUF4386)
MDTLVTTGTLARHRTQLVLAGALIVGGSVANTVVSTFHPHREDPNDHAAVFAEYAASTDWIWVHYAQFAAALTMLAGFVVLYRALISLRPATATDHLALGAVITSAATVTVLQAVDGVALKHTVDGWAVATGQEKTARFADAEAVRWLEWGVNGFFYTMVGGMLVLLGVAMLRRAVLPRWLGCAAVLSGLAFVANAVPVGYRGFQATPAAMAAVLLLAVTAIGVVVAGFRTPRVTGTEEQGSPMTPAFERTR